MKKANAVYVICNGEGRKWSSREEAMEYYLEGVMYCEGSERDRYMNIYMDLMSGKDVCVDE